jgi:methionyl-tRNA synthetase
MLGFQEYLPTVDIRKELKIVSFNATELKEPKILFKKIEDCVIEQEISLLQAELKPQQTTYEPLKQLCTIEQFDMIDLRVGQIVKAEKVEKSKKLLKLQVNLGFEVRTIVSGIALDVPVIEDLIGKKVLIVANLHPAKLMGIESQGMLLAGSLGEMFEIPSLQNLEPGSRVR